MPKLDLLGDIKKLPDKKFGGKESWIVRLEKKGVYIPNSSRKD